MKYGYGWTLQASEATKTLYHKALQRLWTRVGIFCSLGMVWVIATAELELATAGHNTPFIPLSIMVSTRHVVGKIANAYHLRSIWSL